MGAEFTDMLVHEEEKGGLCLDAALQSLLDILSLEVRSLYHKHIESLLDGKQQLLDVLVGLHGFLALALQSAGTRIPKRWKKVSGISHLSILRNLPRVRLPWYMVR